MSVIRLGGQVPTQSLDLAGRFRLSHQGGRAGSDSVIRVGGHVLYQSLEWAACSVSVIRVGRLVLSRSLECVCGGCH